MLSLSASIAEVMEDSNGYYMLSCFMCTVESAVSWHRRHGPFDLVTRCFEKARYIISCAERKCKDESTMVMTEKPLSRNLFIRSASVVGLWLHHDYLLDTQCSVC